MHATMKTIVFGFALMLLGGILVIADAVSEVDMPNLFVFLEYGLFVGFLIVVLGLILYPKKEDEIQNNKE